MKITCPRCGAEMHWQSDCDYNDIGIEGVGIVSMWDCPNCSTSIEVYMTEDTDE